DFGKTRGQNSNGIASQVQTIGSGNRRCLEAGAGNESSCQQQAKPAARTVQHAPHASCLVRREFVEEALEFLALCNQEIDNNQECNDNPQKVEREDDERSGSTERAFLLASTILTVLGYQGSGVASNQVFLLPRGAGNT